MKSFTWLLVLMAFMACYLDGGVMADDIDVTDEDEAGAVDTEEDTYEDDLDDHEVTTSYTIPDYPDGRFPVGQPVTILVDFSNKGQDVLNVSAMQTYLHSPFDINYFIQNFTAKEIGGGVVAPSAQISLAYTFVPDTKLEPLEFWFSGVILYTVEGSDEPYRQVFVNTTVDLFESSNSLDMSSFLTMVLLLFSLGCASYFGLTATAMKMTNKKMKKFTMPKPASPAIDDWDVDTYKPSDKSRRAGARKKISKK